MVRAREKKLNRGKNAVLVLLNVLKPLARNLGQREAVGEMKIKTFFQKSTESTD